jgi:hypothetical protein
LHRNYNYYFITYNSLFFFIRLLAWECFQLERIILIFSLIILFKLFSFICINIELLFMLLIWYRFQHLVFFSVLNLITIYDLLKTLFLIKIIGRYLNTFELLYKRFRLLSNLFKIIIKIRKVVLSSFYSVRIKLLILCP